jgi:tRNA pseudouridine13 synthase
MFWINAYQSWIWNKMASERIKRLGPQPAVGDLYQEDGQTREVKVVTDPTKVTLGMIVLPLPGYDVEYPTNEIGDLYRSTLKADGVEFKKDAVPEATAKGAYRNLVAPANNLAVSFVDTNDDGTVGNALFTFELQAGSYATMLLRELMCTTMSRTL